MPVPKLLRKLSNISLRKKRSQFLDSTSHDALPPSPQEPVPPLPLPTGQYSDGEYDFITPPGLRSYPTESSSDRSYHIGTHSTVSVVQTENYNHDTSHPNGTTLHLPYNSTLEELDYTVAWEAVSRGPAASKSNNLKVLQNLENGILGAQGLQTNSTALVTGIATCLEATGSMKAIEEGVNHFFEGSTILMNALDEVAKLHPFVGVAVMAFKAVWTLEMKRRENDKKIIALYVEMKEMMKVLLQLKDVKDPEEIGPDGSTIKDRMEGLIHTTAEDIKSCANTCDTYSKKKLLVKILKGPIWESRLVAFVATFTKRHSEFEFALSIHTSLGVDAANNTLRSVKQTTEAIEARMDMMVKLFQTFMPPDQKEMARLVDLKGGAKACQENEKILKELSALEPKTGGSSSGALHVGTKLGGRPQASDLEDLKKELHIDPEAATEKNMTVFSRKFDVQLNQLQEELSRVVKREGDRVISAVTSGPHDKIIDPHVHKIWQDMGWRGSVKARTFVMGLRDYFQERWDAHAPAPGSNADNADDSWALAYLNVLRLQPISEAFDDDASGFVTVAEANTFTTSRPLGWSLPYWIAYWAVGWHQSMITYQEKINDLIAKMFAILPDILVSNRGEIHAYLKCVYAGIRTITASLTPCHVNDALQTKFKGYVESEEARLARNLKAVRYDIDAMDTLALVTGPGRIEKFVLPLLYLLLKHHFELFRICQRHITHSEELPDAADTILWVLDAVNDRFDILQSTFKQQKLDLKQQFKSFGHGIFEYKNDASLLWDPKKVNEDETYEYPYDDKFEDQGIEIEDVLNYPYDQEELDLAAYDPPTPEPDISHISMPLSAVLGRWNGFIYLSETANYPAAGMISMTLLAAEGQDLGFQASSRSDMSDFRVSGTCSPGETPNTISVTFSRTFTVHHSTVYFQGRWEVATDTLTGTCGLQVDHTTHDSIFVFKRTTSDHLCFLPSPSASKANRSRALWTFATSSTRAEVLRKRWSWKFFRQRRDNRKRFLALFIRSIQYGRPLDAKELEELEKIRKTFTTADSRFYHSLAAYKIRRTVGHMGYNCDNCGGQISGGRISCLVCQTKNTLDTIDLCETSYCMAAQVVQEGLSGPHLPTHDLVKVRRVVHVRHFGTFYSQAKAALERARSIFGPEAGGGYDDRDVGSEGSSRFSQEAAEIRKMGNLQTCSDGSCALACAVCKSALTQPCWYCVQCPDDIFICYTCDAKGGATFGDHIDNHDLVRCQELVEDVEISVGSRLATLEERSAKHQASMDERLKQLEQKVDDRLSRVEKVLEAVLKGLRRSDSPEPL